MSFNFRKLTDRIAGPARRGALAVVATIAAAATLCSSVAFAADGGGAGSGEGGGGTGDTGGIVWTYKDGDDGSFGEPTNANVRAAMSAVAPGIWIGPWGGEDPDRSINQALTDAVAECQARGNEQCRLVGVGFVHSTGTNSFTGAAGGYTAQQWQAAYTAAGIPTTTWSHNGVPYTTDAPFSDGVTSVNTLANREMSDDPEHTSVIVIVLGEHEPPEPNYDLTLSTDLSSPTSLEVGATDRIVDVIHASNATGYREDLTGTAVVHFDGNDYLAAASVSRQITFSSVGDTEVDLVGPEDFGWSHWPEGTLWVDLQVAQQGRMNAAVDTDDRDPRETLRVSARPPDVPSKSVEDGVSADSMTNTTVISTGTGAGGYELTFRDEITPNGVAYTVSGMKVTDTTTGEDISSQFSMSWDQEANTVTAARSADQGEMPIDHTWEFSFDVTVSLPTDYEKVQDQGFVDWNHEPEQSTDAKEFPTWQPNPDKSWILWDESTSSWQAVIDPDETNSTGGDQKTYVAGDRVASVVNGTWTANAVDAPESFELHDDWSAADYIWDATTDPGEVRVYAAEATTDRESSVSDIVAKGEDVTDMFDITLEATSATASAKPEYLARMKGMDAPMQYTLLIPGEIDFDAAQTRDDFGRAEGEELTFCTNPTDAKDESGAQLTNSASQTVNGQTIDTNEPPICGYVPPVVKDVVSEGSEGGDQESVDGLIVFPGQKLEYQLLTEPQLPDTLAYDVTEVAMTDTYDQWLVPDKQTLEITDLSTGRTIGKSQYTTTWSDAEHSFRVAFSQEYVAENWRPGSNPRIMLRFEGTVSEDAPAESRVDNTWALTLNNSLTPSNLVYNVPPSLEPGKDVTIENGSVSVDGKTFLLGDTFDYRVTIDATGLGDGSTAYDVQRLGVIDDYDEAYLRLDEDAISVLDDQGVDVTDRLNIQVRDGVVYAAFRTVDTYVDALGETLPGDPQPDDLDEYLHRDLDPLADPSIDQSVLGHAYTLVLPMTVIRVDDGYVVENTATQITNDREDVTNTVTNPLAPINPAKDVTVTVGGDSVDGDSIWLDSLFLYRLDSSVLPPDRAYQEVSEWSIVDPLDTAHDEWTGQWAVYASRDLYRDGELVAEAGDRIAGSGVDSDLFTCTEDEQGIVTVAATESYLDMVSADTEHEQGWTAYLQCRRVATGERIENSFVEHLDGRELPSNTVVTVTPDMTPSLTIEKWDEGSGWPDGDRDTSDEALTVDGDTTIVFTITNTSSVDPDTGVGAWFKASDLKLED